MKKVLHFITGLESGGGAENMLIKTLPYLKKTENVVCAIKGRGAIGAQLEAKGVKVHYLMAKSYFDFSVIWKYKKVVQNCQPDVQVNYLIHADFFGRIFAKFFGIPKVISYIRNKHDEGIFGLMDKWTIKLSDFFLFNSKANQNFYHENRKLSTTKTSFIANGIALNDFNINKNSKYYRKNLSLSDEEFIILTVARLDKQKDHVTLFKALEKSKSVLGDKFKLLLCGKGREEKSLRQLAKDIGLENNILFLGHRDDVKQIMQIADLFVLPSIHEGMSNALLEAMTSELPCLVSDINENKELIEDAKNGLTFEVSNVDDLSQKIKTLYQDINLRDHYASQARKTIEKEYDIEKIIEHLDNFLSEFDYNSK